MEKKHLSGYECAKRKIAKLEIEKAALEQENATLVQQLHDARDKWSDANAEKLSFEADLKMCKKMRDNICERYVWLYEHAPFWLKWWFKHTFKGATK